MLGLALGALALVTVPSSPARADGSDEPPGEGQRVVKIGPQAVVIVDEAGNAIMYDDPTQQVDDCPQGVRGCWVYAADEVFGLLFFARANVVDAIAAGGASATQPPEIVPVQAPPSPSSPSSP
jgi:hypothetical protein